MQKQRGRRFVQNRIHQVSEYCQFIQEQCVARYVQQCSYKALRQAGVFRKVEKKIEPIGLVSEYHQGESTGPNYDPEDMCQNKSDVVKIVNDLVELCADTTCQYINDFDLSLEVTSNSFNPFSLANLEAPSFADKTVKGIKGLNIPFNYYGSPMHLDDYGLSTTSFHVAGATKVWITIAPKDKLRFQKLVEVSLPPHSRRRRRYATGNFQVLTNVYFRTVGEMAGQIFSCAAKSRGPSPAERKYIPPST
ncbi:unnamed protein product [Allacma fusca]|uniref:Uncharacterized protein n=1 Tax=Allacma fusca TaxID=39272 RepID=A0A8J2NZ76_9HEXA|nr:unnamed protein product [Allacma fusca]